MKFRFEKTSAPTIGFYNGHDSVLTFGFLFRMVAENKEWCQGYAWWSDCDGWSVKSNQESNSEIQKYILAPDYSSDGWDDAWFTLDANTHTEEECEKYEEEVLDAVCYEFTKFCYDVVANANEVLRDNFEQYKDDDEHWHLILPSNEFSLNVTETA